MCSVELQSVSLHVFCWRSACVDSEAGARVCARVCVTERLHLKLSGSVTSVHSQPCGGRALLQVPDASPARPRLPSNLIPPRIAPPSPSPSPRALRRQVSAADTHTHTPPVPFTHSDHAVFWQVAVKLDSVESQSCEQQERPNPAQLPPPSPSQLSPQTSSPSPLPPPPPSSPMALSLPPGSASAFPLPPTSPAHLSALLPALPPPPPSPSLLLPPPPSPRHPLRSPGLHRPRPYSSTSVRDPADEEVCHITSSACHRWREEEGDGLESRGKVGRSHSLSPYTSPYSLDYSPPPPSMLPSSSSKSTLNLLQVGLKDRDFRKGFSVDNQGFLEKPASLSVGFPEEQRRHSIEVCLPQSGVAADDRAFEQEVRRTERGGQAFPVRVQSVGGGHRKKKISPPCISIHPPSEREHPQPASPPQLTADCSMTLRRRTPSYDLTHHTPSKTHTQDVLADTQMLSPVHAALAPVPITIQALSPTHTLTPSRASTPVHMQSCTPPHPSTPTHSHIPISPHIFIQPHAPLVPNPMPFSQTHSLSPIQRHASLSGDCVPLPQFTFDQPQSRFMSGLSAGLSDTDTATCSSPFDTRLGGGAGFSAKNRRTAQ